VSRRLEFLLVQKLLNYRTDLKEKHSIDFEFKIKEVSLLLFGCHAKLHGYY
jgi:hypothetical protein